MKSFEPSDESHRLQMVICQGETYWLGLDEPSSSEPGFRHPFVAVQNDAFNRGKIGTAVVSALTSNLKLASAPGNVLLKKGEANLPKASVVKEGRGNRPGFRVASQTPD
jgi:mRNA interferase MazF